MKKKDKRIVNLERYVNRLARQQTTLTPVESKLRCCIVIPSYHEKELLATLHSLAQCNKPPFPFEVIIVLNSSEACEETVQNSHREQYEQLKKLNFSFPIHPILLENIPRKKAGVGLARKTGMDIAAGRLLQSDPIDGLIVCLDGDCYVSNNYLERLQLHFQSEKAKQAAHLHFEHPFPTDSKLRSSIIHYEMHLRLMKLFLESSGHPQAFHAVGSCLAVRAWAYASQGGMNTRQAGEDFYFIHKFSAIGQLQELNDITVYPASRVSDRVPFGTGAAMKKNIEGIEQLTYHPSTYIQIEKIIKAIPEFYAGNYRRLELFKDYHVGKVAPKLDEIRMHTTNIKTFQQRFCSWFDAFQVIKFLHYLRDTEYPNMPIDRACNLFFQQRKITAPNNIEDQLLLLRKIDRQENFE